ncbi:MAG: hypothetical protein LBT78_03350, partial [Tannerella sp.]|nr:hypothetical protein [Tannerella sp.]
MKQKENSIARAFVWIRSEQGGRKLFGSLIMLTAIAALMLCPLKANAAVVGVPAGTNILTPVDGYVSFHLTSATDLPVKILTDSATYYIYGDYSGDYGEPVGAKGLQLTPAQSAERKSPAGAGLIQAGATNHGIYVASGLKNVTVILENVGIVTGGVNNAAFIIDGVNVGSGNNAASFQGYPAGSNVVVELKGRNLLYSGNIPGCNRAGLEVWKGSTVYIEGDGYLLAKSSTTRNYSTASYPRLATDAHPQGSPYWDTSGDVSTHEDLQAVSNGNRSGAAGIGSGDVSGSGGNVVIRGGRGDLGPKIIAISGAHGAGIGGS